MSGASLNVTITQQIADIGQAGWDALSAGQPFTSYQWYCFGEQAMTGCLPLYVSVWQGKRVVARASFWLVNNEPLPVKSRLVRGSLHAFLRVRPLLICRAPLADASGLILPADLPPDVRQSALQAILSAARDWAARSRASFLVFDYLDPEQAGLPGWPPDLPTTRLDDPGTRLPLAFDSYDAYLGSLSKTAWKDYRRQRNQAERLGLVVATHSTVRGIDEALPLIRRVEQRHGSSPKPWARAMLENAALVPSTWITARVGERLVGCGLLLADGGVQLATLLGLDETVPYVYFQIVYRAIRQAIEQGARALRAGSGAYELKQRLGFQLETNNHLRFGGQGFFGWAARLAA